MTQDIIGRELQLESDRFSSVAFPEVVASALTRAYGVAAWRWRRILAVSADEMDVFLAQVRTEFEIEAERIGVHTPVLPSQILIATMDNAFWFEIICDEEGILRRHDTNSPLRREELSVCYAFSKRSGSAEFSLKMIFPVGGKERSLIRQLFLASFVISLTIVVMPLYMNALYDRVLPAHADASLWALSVGVVLAIVVEFLVKQKRKQLFSDLAVTIHRQAESTFARAILSLNDNIITDSNSKQIDGLRDWNTLRSVYWAFANSNVIDAPFVVLYLIAILLVAGWLFFVPLVFLIVFSFVLWRFWRHDKLSPPLQAFSSRPVAAKEIVLARAIDRVDITQGRTMAGAETALLINQERSARLSFRYNFLGALASLQTVAIVVVAFYLTVNGLMNPAGLFAVTLLSARIIQPLMSLVSLINPLQEAMEAYKRLYELLAKDNSAISEAKGAVVPSLISGHAPLWDVKDVSLFKTADEPILKNISLTIRQGEKVAIVGSPNSGKSALLKLLAGVMQPDTGNLDFLGIPLPKARTEIAKTCHYMWQENILLAETPYEYLCLDEPHGREKCRDILASEGFVDRSASGALNLDAQWHREGVYPTPSQFQLLAVARLSLSRKNVLLIDMPSDYLNRRRELQLIRILKEKLTSEASLILVTDRVEFLPLVDRVIYLDKGTIKYDGPRGAFRGQSDSKD